MTVDVVCTWKDEDYRQSMSNEQMIYLPAHPSEELSSADLASVCGGSEGGLDRLDELGLANLVTSNAFTSHKKVHWHSVNVVCDNNTFSTRQTIPRTPAVLSPITVICTDHS